MSVRRLTRCRWANRATSNLFCPVASSAAVLSRVTACSILYRPLPTATNLTKLAKTNRVRGISRTHVPRRIMRLLFPATPNVCRFGHYQVQLCHCRRGFLPGKLRATSCVEEEEGYRDCTSEEVAELLQRQFRGSAGRSGVVSEGRIRKHLTINSTARCVFATAAYFHDT